VSWTDTIKETNYLTCDMMGRSPGHADTDYTGYAVDLPNPHTLSQVAGRQVQAIFDSRLEHLESDIHLQESGIFAHEVQGCHFRELLGPGGGALHVLVPVQLNGAYGCSPMWIASLSLCLDHRACSQADLLGTGQDE